MTSVLINNNGQIILKCKTISSSLITVCSLIPRLFKLSGFLLISICVGMNVFYKYSCHIIEQMEDLRRDRDEEICLPVSSQDGRRVNRWTEGRRGPEREDREGFAADPVSAFVRNKFKYVRWILLVTKISTFNSFT